MSQWYESLDDGSLHFYVPDKEFTPIRKDSRVKLAGFDFDGTLIQTNCGEKYCTKATNWVFPYSNTVEILKKYSKEGWTIAVFSNRKNEKEKVLETTRCRVEEFFRRSGIKFFVFLATEENHYRKPEVGMLETLLKLCSAKSFTEDSFYTGDAVGENAEDPWHRWGNADSKMIENWNNSNSPLIFKQLHEVFEPFKIEIPQNIKVLITCGQKGSGYDLFSHPDVVNVTLKTLPKKLENKICVIGSFSTIAERDKVRKKLDITREESLVVWFSRPCRLKIAPYELKHYTSSFQHPELVNEKFIRYN